MQTMVIEEDFLELGFREVVGMGITEVEEDFPDVGLQELLDSDLLDLDLREAEEERQVKDLQSRQDESEGVRGLQGAWVAL